MDLLPAWVFVAAALVALLALARLARLRPTLAPLVRPFALSVATFTLLVALDGLKMPWSGLSLLVLGPLLMLVVRTAVIGFEWGFRRRQGVPAPALLDTVVSVALYGLGAAFVAHRFFGIELTPVLATSAVVGGVVGLALQDTLGNLFAGIGLHTELPLRVGDWVRIGAAEGRVEQVSWRSTQLQTWYGDTITLPNNLVARQELLNFSLPRAPHSRVLTLSAAYQAPPNKVLAVLRELLLQVPAVLKSPAPVVRPLAYRDSGIEYEIRYFVARYEDYRDAEAEVYRLTWYHFRRHGIEIPYPTRSVLLHRPAQLPRDGAAGRLERALRAIDFFRPLSEAELKLATERFRHLHYAAGERIIEEGDPGDSFFVIDRGEVEVTKTRAGAALRLARLMEGQFFGEMALMTGESRAARVVAATDVDLFTIASAGFHDIVVKNPALAVEISTILSQRREALSALEAEAESLPSASPVELKQHILDRIRSYFGI